MQTPESRHPKGQPLQVDLSELTGSARSAQQRGDLQEAARLLDEANKKAPGQLIILIDLANILRLLSRLDEAESIFAQVLSRTPGHVAALVGLGHIARQRGCHSDALAYFEAAGKNAPNNLNIRGEIGNSLIATKRLEDAEGIFLSILEKEPRDIRALLGLANLARDRRQWQIALDYFQKAAAVRPDEISIQMETANMLRALGRLDQAAAKCIRILEKSPENAGVLMTAGYIERQQRKYDVALKYFRTAGSIDPSNLKIQLEIANALRELDRLEDAEIIFRAVLEKQPDQVAALLGLGSIARHRSDFDLALAHFRAASAADPSNIRVQVEIANTLRELMRLDEAEAACEQALSQSPNDVWILLCLGYIDRERADWSGALAHFQAAGNADPSNLKAQLELAGTFRELLRIEEAEAILQRLDDDPAARIDPDFQAKKLEHFCRTLQLDKADECVAAWGSRDKVPMGAVAFTAAFYAARSRWHEVLDLFRERVVESTVKPKIGSLLLEAVSRATRATRRYAEVLSLVDRLSDLRCNSEVVNLRNQILEEIRLLRTLDLPDHTTKIVHDEEINSPLRTWRANLMEQILSPDHRANRSKTIYFCTDRNYLPGAVVAVSSLLRNNTGELRNYFLRVYCSGDVMELAAAIFGELGTAFSFPIDLRNSTSLIPAGSTFRTGWGMFTPGHQLSEAAYYRIYAALQMLLEGVEGRALYIDSDVCVGANLNQLIEFDLQGQPLGARRENPSLVEIRRAALRLDIPPEEYFNSGVLLFDLTHAGLASALQNAVEISLTQKGRLTFVDQCALNLAFRDMYAVLPEVFNFFVREDTEVNTNEIQPQVRHFLQRPKPWDPMYSSVNSKSWFEEFATLAQFVSPSKLKQLLALQFPDLRPPNQGCSG
jgi:tetratricopeptide (TPR) repeat protein